jgi:3-deoxy-7-phosphoheptulonate synthase
MFMAAIAAGADGLILIVHSNPAMAESDGGQSLKLELTKALMEKLCMIAPCVDRKLASGEKS